MEDKIKYELQYINGGITEDGIKVTPSEDGRLKIEIAIYGGGKKKSLLVTSKKGKIAQYAKAFAAANRQSDPKNGNEVGAELQAECESIQKELALRLIELMKRVDGQTKKIIQEVLSR